MIRMLPFLGTLAGSTACGHSGAGGGSLPKVSKGYGCRFCTGH